MKTNNNPTIETLQKEINLLTQKLEDIHNVVHRNHWELQNCIRFNVADTQIAFKMWQMNIPSIGELVEIKYFFEDEIYGYVSGLFGNQKSKIKENNGLSEHFSFTVKSVVCSFTEDEDFENDSGCEYTVYLTPNVSTDISSQ
jgi:hypothetical protein